LGHLDNNADEKVERAKSIQRTSDRDPVVDRTGLGNFADKIEQRTAKETQNIIRTEKKNLEKMVRQYTTESASSKTLIPKNLALAA
jgi:hypothetical protein